MKTVSMGNIKGTKRNRYIIIVCLIAVKMAIMGLFSSDYQDTMFIPFVRTFLSGVNPYEYFYQNGLPSSFPYFPYMLFIESVGGLLLKLFSPTGIFFRNFLFKIPLLMFDVAGFIVLRKMGIRFKYATILYFCSPVIIFGTYVHGQLDIIPTVFLLIAVYFLVSWRKKYNLVAYAVFLGIAIGCKFHIMAAVPILFFYLAKKKNYVTSLLYHLLSGVVVFVPCIFFRGGWIFLHSFAEQGTVGTHDSEHGLWFGIFGNSNSCAYDCISKGV